MKESPSSTILLRTGHWSSQHEDLEQVKAENNTLVSGIIPVLLHRSMVTYHSGERAWPCTFKGKNTGGTSNRTLVDFAAAVP